ncbi:MAG: FxsA family protein [Planctomycetaceae bacterium]|nr:FxsA family protein [Planctomycetaceae bacterium]
MPVLGRLILILILVPLIELAFLYQLFLRTSFLTTFAVVMLTGIVGVQLARFQGLAVWRAVQEQLRQGRTPSAEIMDGVMILLAGALLISPGLLTDTVGFLLLVRHIRRWIAGRLRRWFFNKTQHAFQTHVRTHFRTADSSADETDVAADSRSRPHVRVLDPDAD